MGIAVSSLTRNLKSAVDAGWVARSAGNDGRSRSAALTGAAQQRTGAPIESWELQDTTHLKEIK